MAGDEMGFPTCPWPLEEKNESVMFAPYARQGLRGVIKCYFAIVSVVVVLPSTWMNSQT